MRTSTPTAVKEDYLRAIYRLQEKSGSDNSPVKLTDLAQTLGLSKSTVSERVDELSDQGLVVHAPYSPLTFTKKGRTLARKLTHKHRIIEVFLHDVLHIPKSEIHAEAHRLEHAMSDKVIKKLGDFLGNPTHDSHGAVIPEL